MSALSLLIVPPVDQSSWQPGQILVLLGIALIGLLLIRNISAIRFRTLNLKVTTPALLSFMLVFLIMIAKLVFGAW